MDGECADCRKKNLSLRRHPRNSSALNIAPPVVEDVLQNAGQPLDSESLSFMKLQFGHDFSRVRVHIDRKAQISASAVDALAYTVGNHIIFNRGEYRPGSPRGDHLLAHELTHVIQNEPEAKKFEGPIQIGPPSGRFEESAEKNANSLQVGTGTRPVPAVHHPGTDPSDLGAPLLRRFTKSEQNQISDLDSVVGTAKTIADETGLLGLMRWGRFTAGAGGIAALEVVADAMSEPQSGSTEVLSNRYLFSCRCGLIDMRHFYQLMYIGLLAGNETATEKGREHELTAEKSSRFAPEDTASNALGAAFGAQQSIAQRQSTFVNNLKSLLENCDPVDFTSLSQQDQQTVVNFYSDRDSSGAPANPSETAVPEVLQINACSSRDRSAPFTVDPKDSDRKTIDTHNN